jgi:hypothetical protein
MRISLGRMTRLLGQDVARANAEAATAELLHRRQEQLEVDAFVAELTDRARQAAWGVR